MLKPKLFAVLIACLVAADFVVQAANSQQLSSGEQTILVMQELNYLLAVKQLLYSYANFGLSTANSSFSATQSANLGTLANQLAAQISLLQSTILKLNSTLGGNNNPCQASHQTVNGRNYTLLCQPQILQPVSPCTYVWSSSNATTSNTTSTNSTANPTVFSWITFSNLYDNELRTSLAVFNSTGFVILNGTNSGNGNNNNNTQWLSVLDSQMSMGLVGGRHASWVAVQATRPPFPLAFEVPLFTPDSFNFYSPYIVSCPYSLRNLAASLTQAERGNTAGISSGTTSTAASTGTSAVTSGASGATTAVTGATTGATTAVTTGASGATTGATTAVATTSAPSSAAALTYSMLGGVAAFLLAF